jgi:predicted transcriptional regulator
MWLEEGLCTTAEGYELAGDRVTFTPRRNNFRFTDLRAAIVQDRFLPLEELLTMDSGEAVGGSQEAATGYYGQLWALAQFIRSNPATLAGMQRLLADAEAGRLNQALNVSPRELAALRHRGREYNKTVSLPLFRIYITADLPSFEKDFKAFAVKLERLQ